jgi:hypothetical protein
MTRNGRSSAPYVPANDVTAGSMSLPSGMLIRPPWGAPANSDAVPRALTCQVHDASKKTIQGSSVLPSRRSSRRVVLQLSNAPRIHAAAASSSLHAEGSAVGGWACTGSAEDKIKNKTKDETRDGPREG